MADSGIRVTKVALVSCAGWLGGVLEMVDRGRVATAVLES